MSKKKNPEKRIISLNDETDHEVKIFPKNSFPIVGIGASAGGLAAFEAFFSAMPADRDIGMAFILVQHLAPQHKSILAELVRHYTRMQVFEVTDGMTVQPNCAYIIPPNRDMAFFSGKLQLLEMDPQRGQRLPIDFFFRSLAKDLQERAICIVLSGTGSDGTLGVRAIKGEGGMVIVQNPETTEYNGMPLNAIATGMVDFVLEPAEMPAQLIVYTEHAFSKTSQSIAPQPIVIENVLKKICMLLQVHTGHDFSLYKQNTLNRRIERRMAVNQIEQMEEYIKYLQQNQNEVEALFRDLLIGVTSFFRDPEAFEELQKQVILKLFENKTSGSLIRVWVPGCSTGEEAYSIAILLYEQMEILNKHFTIQIFATDIDCNAIETARIGVYPASIATDILPERLVRYFSLDEKSNNYRINKNIRDMLIFSKQDLIKDPPFSKLNMISCRNLLIYLSGTLQKKLIPLFHYALLPDAWLFLGTSESVGDFTNLFKAVSRKNKLYQRKADITNSLYPSIGGFLSSKIENGVHHRYSKQDTSENKINLRELTEEAILQQYSPVGVLVNERGDILYLYGRTGMFLEPAPGESNMNVLMMAREGLKRDLTSALHHAVTRKEPVSCMGVQIKTNSHFTTINLTVRPVKMNADELNTLTGLTAVKLSSSAALFIIIFEEVTAVPQKQTENVAAIDMDKHPNISILDTDVQITALKQELQLKDEYLQSTIEELETANEELMTSNEELQSVNEELQSTNEELETSKEELQSVNEELATVNNELQLKVDDLSRLNNDMNNLIAGTGVGTIFVDHQLCILRFTPAVTKMINLILSDIGRPVNHIASNLIGYNQLAADVQSVLDSLIPKEIEVQIQDDAWYIMRIMPYRTIDNVIEGAVITFMDVTERKLAEEKIKALLVEKEHILKEVHHRIKNNMNTISSLLNLQANSVKEPSAISALTDAKGRVDSMTLLYNKLYNSDDLSEISINKYLPSLIDEIVANFPLSKSIKIEKKIDDFVLDAKRLQPLAIIINELITNIMKYAFTDKEDGLITISATLTDNHIAIVIQDNGNGIPESINFKNSTGFGLILVEILTKQIQGTIRIDRKNGSKIILEFEM